MKHTAAIVQPDDVDAFRRVAKRLLAAQVKPADIIWTDEAANWLFGGSLPNDEKTMTVPRSFLDLATLVACHRDEARWHLLYTALWRIDRGEHAVMERATDPLIHKLLQMAASVRHDQHRMTAFVRFRSVANSGEDHFVAWYQPCHQILRGTASFFINRFANMRFSIVTPDLSLHWDTHAERYSSGLRREHMSSDDAVEEWWRGYYAATFNPARTNARLMQRHMPKRFWRDLPEAKAIAALVDEAGARTERMIQSSSGRTASDGPPPSGATWGPSPPGRDFARIPDTKPLA